jgi:hypothetical protein
MPAKPHSTTAALVAAFLSLAALAACDPISAHQSPILLPPQVEMLSDSLANDTAVQTPSVHRIPGTGQLVVGLQVENRTNNPMVLEYQYEFLNHGMLKQDWSGWMPLRLPPRSDAMVPNFMSMEAEVDDFRIHFRRAQVN